MLPCVLPFCAIKCNSNKMISNISVKSGCCFDCASKAEIEYMLSMGV
jgi:ornithine decarboxylase